MRNYVTGFFMSWGMFCSIPNPYKKWDKDLYPYMLLCLPLLGLLLGGIWALTAWLLHIISAPKALYGAILTVLPWLASGFIHLDGYMDCADAILSRRDMETKRKILKDSHVGSFAVICIVILALMSFSLLFEGIPSGFEACLIFISAVCRGAGAFAVLYFPPLETSGYRDIYNRKATPAIAVFTITLTVIFTLLPVVLFGLRGLCGAASLAGAFLTIAYGRKNLGGMSGDISGAAITIGELCGIAFLVLV